MAHVWTCTLLHQNNLTLSVASAYDSAIHLLNYTQDGALQDKIDVVFIAQTLEKYLRYIPGNLEVCYFLIPADF